MPAEPVPGAVMQDSIALWSRLEAATDVLSCLPMRLSIVNKAVKFGDPQLNRSTEI